MNCLEIIMEYLKENGYDGLVDSDNGCGCGLDDLILCSEDFSGCKPAHKVMCQQPCTGDECGHEHDYPECGGYLFCETKDSE